MTPEHTFVIHRMHDRFTQEGKQIFFLVGADPGAGVSDCGLNIALRAAEMLENHSVLLIDMNLHSPKLSEKLRNPQNGWLSWLTKDKGFPLEEAIRDWPGSAHLRFLPTGRIKDFGEITAQMLRWSDMLDVLREKFDLIIADLPAFYQGTEARIFCKSAEDIMIVIEAERTRKPVARQMTEELRAMNAPVSGILFNKRRSHIPEWIRRRLF